MLLRITVTSLTGTDVPRMISDSSIEEICPDPRAGTLGVRSRSIVKTKKGEKFYVAEDMDSLSRSLTQLGGTNE